MKTVMRGVAMVVAVILLGGCSGLSAVGKIGELASECKTDIRKTARREKEKLRDWDQRLLLKAENFLDCAVGPAKTPGAKLLRGHIVVAVLARYGAFNLLGDVGTVYTVDFRSYDKMKDDAQRILLSIEKAETRLRRASRLFPALLPKVSDLPAFQKPGVKIHLPEVNKEYGHLEKQWRVLAVARVLRDVERPTYHRARGIFTSLISFAGAPSLGGGKILLSDALNAFKKFGIVKNFAGAYLSDGKNFLIKFKSAQIKKTDWEPWDMLIKDACARLAKVAQSNPHCLP